MNVYFISSNKFFVFCMVLILVNYTNPSPECGWSQKHEDLFTSEYLSIVRSIRLEGVMSESACDFHYSRIFILEVLSSRPHRQGEAHAVTRKWFCALQHCDVDVRNRPASESGTWPDPCAPVTRSLRAADICFVSLIFHYTCSTSFCPSASFIFSFTCSFIFRRTCPLLHAFLSISFAFLTLVL